MSPSDLPSALSLIVPVYNSADTLDRCLRAIAGQIADTDELLVVDDGSTDDPGRVALRYGATFVRQEVRSGVAAARNAGAAFASRPSLFFLDADVVPHADALARARAWMANPSIDAVIGSYDDSPAAPTVVSRFKNLAHHHFHQQAAGPIASFWGACGCVRRDVFMAAGGFDQQRFSRPSIEDVELGWRMADRGARIVLDPDLQVTHLKQWTLRSLIRTDIVQRAIPWVRWSIERRRPMGDLNTSSTQQVAAIVAALLVVSLFAAIFTVKAQLALVGLVVCAAALNWPLFRLFWRRGGAALLLGGFLLQQVYYLCALTGVVVGVLFYRWPRRRLPVR